MRMSRWIASVSLLMSILSPDSLAQNQPGPEVSVLPRFRIDSNDGVNLPAKREWSRPEFNLEEFELGFQGSLSPHARGDVFLTKTGLGNEPIELKEVNATFQRDLPLDMEIRIGKYLAQFGYLNQVHAHAWSFVTTPLSVARFLGDKGVNDLGVSVSLPIPLGDFSTRLTFDLLKGNTIGIIDPKSGAVAGGPGLADTLGKSSYANSARLVSVLTLTKYDELEVGISGLTGIHDPYNNLRFFYGNVDFKYRWKPNPTTSFTLQGEALLNSRVVAVPAAGQKRISTSGFYCSGNYQFQRDYSVGVRGDWSQSPYSQDDKAYGGAVFIGYAVAEQSAAIRLHYEMTTIDDVMGGSSKVNSIVLQFMFSMGPHKAHSF